MNRSESEFAVEESDVWGLLVSLRIWEVSIGGAEGGSPLFLQSGSGFKSLDVVFLDVLEVEIVDDESGWDNVVLVDDFDERLDSSSLDELLLVNASLD